MVKPVRTRDTSGMGPLAAADRGEASGASAGAQRCGRLAVLATPIGNLGDISSRARDVLSAADLVVCEDTRVTGRLLSLLDIRRPMLAYHDHNATRVRPRVLAALMEGRQVALVSDAGTPCISDPGHKLVREAAERGIEVVAVPGPSAVIAALSIAGLPTDRFLFVGFLPPRSPARRTALSELSTVRATLVLYEAGPRLASCLADAEAVLGLREAAIAREVTKRFEEVRRGSLAKLAAEAAAAGSPKGEIVVVIGPPELREPTADRQTVEALLIDALAKDGPSAAAAAVAATTGHSRREVYRWAVELRARAQK